MNGVDFGKRIVQFFWDPEPRNYDPSKPPIWCLGLEYPADLAPTGRPASKHDAAHPLSLSEPSVDMRPVDDSSSSSQDEALAYSEISGGGNEDLGWPSALLDDFESKFWMRYRSNFPPIPRSQRPTASSAMTFSVRLRSQLGDKAGFTSDVGWGCMIRSGQSLLANAIARLRLGRGALRVFCIPWVSACANA